MLNAQADPTIRMGRNEYKYQYTGGATDLVDGAVSLSKVFAVSKDDMYFVTVQVDIDTSDSQATIGNLTVTLAGSYDNSNYTTISSAVTYGCTVDTVFSISNKSYTQTEAASIAQHTITTAAATDYVNWVYDTVGTRIQGEDTITVAQRVGTVAAQTITSTVTKTQPGCDYDYVRLTMTGTAAGVHVELQAIEIKITKVP